MAQVEEHLKVDANPAPAILNDTYLLDLIGAAGSGSLSDVQREALHKLQTALTRRTVTSASTAAIDVTA